MLEDHICTKASECPLLIYLKKENLISQVKERNIHIRNEWIDLRKQNKAMKCIDILSENHYLSKERIQAIVYAKEK